MVSIHTFEMKIALRRSEQELILKKLNVPPGKQNWTEHRYNNIGIQIILYKGKKKKFIYLKYIINPKRIFDGKDYLNLLEPKKENISILWETIRKTWAEIGCGIPFGRFYLSRLDFTCDIHLDTEELVAEYIRLLGKSILLPATKRFSVTGIRHDTGMAEDTKTELQKNCCKFGITACEDIQYYNKIFELENENLPVPEYIENEDAHILRIELQIHKTKRISELLQDFQIHNRPIEEQFSYFMEHADFFLLSRLEKLYMPGRYRKKLFIEAFIKDNCAIREKTRKRIRTLVEHCNKNISLGRCLELDKQNGSANKRQKALECLSRFHISPVCIQKGLKGYDELPDIFELVEHGSKHIVYR